MKVKVKRNVKTASFELLTDFTPERQCSNCGLVHNDCYQTPFTACEDGEWKYFKIADFRFCPRCGKKLRTPEDFLPGYVPEWARD